MTAATMRSGGNALTEFAAAGMNSDVPPFAGDPSVWTYARNVRFVANRAERVGGAALMFQGAAAGLRYVIPAPYWFFGTIIAGVPWFLYLGAAGVGVTNGTNHYDVTPAGWTAPQPGTINGALFNGVIVFGSPVRAPYYWKGGTAPGSVATLPGWFANTQAGLVRTFKSHIFAADFYSSGVRSPDRIAWSDAAAPGQIPGTWTPTVSNQAGELYLSETLGAITDARPLGDFLMAYKASGAYAISFVGRPFIYSARRIAAAVGCISSNSIAELRGKHVVLSAGDVVLTDGFNVTSIVDQRMRKALFGELDATQLEVAHCLHYPARSEVWVCLPRIGDDAACSLAGIWNYTTDTWSLRDLPGIAYAQTSVYIPPGAVGGDTWDSDQVTTWAEDQGTWAEVEYSENVIKVMGASAAAGGLVAFDVSDDELGAPIVGEVRRESLPIGGTAYVKHVSRLIPRITAPSDSVFEVRLGVQMAPSDPIAWQAARTVTMAQLSQGIAQSAQGRFASVSIKGSTLAPWNVDGFAIEYKQAGRF